MTTMVTSPQPTSRNTLLDEDLLAIHNLSATHNAEEANYGRDLRSHEKAYT